MYCWFMVNLQKLCTEHVVSGSKRKSLVDVAKVLLFSLAFISIISSISVYAVEDTSAPILVDLSFVPQSIDVTSSP